LLHVGQDLLVEQERGDSGGDPGDDGQDFSRTKPRIIARIADMNMMTRRSPSSSVIGMS
jgi:hypothetical protein